MCPNYSKCQLTVRRNFRKQLRINLRSGKHAEDDDRINDDGTNRPTDEPDLFEGADKKKHPLKSRLYLIKSLAPPMRSGVGVPINQLVVNV